MNNKKPDPELVKYVLFGCGLGLSAIIILILFVSLVGWISSVFGDGWAAAFVACVAGTIGGGAVMGCRWKNKKNYDEAYRR